MKRSEITDEICDMLFSIVMNKAEKKGERLTMREINRRMEKFGKNNTESAIRCEYGRLAK